MDDYLTNSAAETNVFTESLKSLPDLERELRQLHTYSHQYDIPVS